MIIDTHTHFYDPTRPEGVPWPRPDDTFLYRTTLPEHYKAVAVPEGVTGTVVVEASAWVEDNRWVLDLAENDPFLVGLVGHLEPPDPNFSTHLARFAAHPLFRGIRVGVQDWGDERYLSACEELAALDLSVDLHIGGKTLHDAAGWAQVFPDLRIVLNHVALVPVTGGAPDPEWVDGIRDIARYPNVFCKVSGMAELTGQKPACADPAYYAPIIDVLWKVFGTDRLVYGSNWPVSWRFAEYASIQRIAVAYFEQKGTEALEKVMAGNSRGAYKWVSR
ncbi:MAG: amidohydrolase family protein [candidate division Zixibacteria bacterium]|nr:amidohydrolase family protein [candidate division Zixibacteria bacterium]